ncbi:metallophosphoesterase family protein [Lachnospira multipara]|uniref:metallophosphoesterase family protein n=1 Tax=Lachnospira multipara TaxID=28051 RepID=UPI00047F7136|nr:DNA repair exonuclease [Lachnospira multipara]
MKIIHCADLHLDSSLNTNFDERQSKERKLELINTFERLLRYADENLVDAIIIAGDLFDTPNVSKSVKNIVIDGITRLKDIDFYYLKGNHDEYNIFDEMRNIPENLHLFDDKWKTYTAFTTKDFDITITGKELNSKKISFNADKLELDQFDINIVTLHGQISDYEQKADPTVIPLNKLMGKNIDYLALGHIHSYQEGKLGARGEYAYCGALEGRGFDEIGPKGFVLLNINEENKEITKTFVPFAKRVIEEIWVDITDASTTLEVIDLINEGINETTVTENNILKIVLAGEILVESDINLEVISRHFNNCYYCVKIVNDTRFKLNYSDYAHEESLKGEFVREVANDSSLSNEEKLNIINIGIKALSNELGRQDYEIN